MDAPPLEDAADPLLDAVSRPALLLDRDGTVCRERGYLGRPEDLELLPGAASAIRRARSAGYAVVLITNQSAVARGLFDLKAVHAVHRHLQALLQAEQAYLDGIFVCPHHPQGAIARYSGPCDCRKPAPGLLLRAAERHELDLGRSTMIGDRLRDLEAGWAAGCRAALVRSGHGQQEFEYHAASIRERGGQVHTDLAAAVTALLGAERNT